MKPAKSSIPIDIGTLDRTYAVVREIGRGGMGAVVLARHREAFHHVAIKIASTDSLDADALARFAREAHLMARFRHPNIVGLYNIEQIGQGRVGIIMEYVRGRSLAQLLAEGRGLPFAQCLSILGDVAQALAHAHGSGVVHRDVKPQNVLVEDDTGRAKLADFGIAKVTTGGTDVTATGMALGTPAYMSPEQIDGVAIDGRSDLYSLGVVAWEAITGHRPWAGDSLFKILYNQKHQPLPSVASFRPDTPPRLLYALEGMLAKDPAHRWPSAADLLAQLERDAPTPVLMTCRESAAARPRSRRESAGPDASTIPIARHPRWVNAGAAATASPTDDTQPVSPDDPTTSAVARQGRTLLGLSRRALRSAAHFGGGVLVGGAVSILLVWRLVSGPTAAPVPEPRTAVTTRGIDTTGPSAAASAAGDATAQAPAAPRSDLRAAAATRAVPPAIAPAFVERLPEGERLPLEPARGPRSARTDPLHEFAGGSLTKAIAASPAFPAARYATPLDRRAVGFGIASRARSLAYAARWRAAAPLIDSALGLDPTNGAAYALRARLRMARAEMREAWTDIEMAQRTGARWEGLALATSLRARERSAAEARVPLRPYLQDALTPRRTLEAERAVMLAAALAQVGDTSIALTLLEQAATSDARLPDLLRDPLLSPIRSSARFARVRQAATGVPSSRR